ncbi:MAG: hypothetical protein M1827_000073 [Pycnora praestabilis]|nr:MAG: hypothetical protein M1827_000073 [Pycnora praestabilis]
MARAKRGGVRGKVKGRGGRSSGTSLRNSFIRSNSVDVPDPKFSHFSLREEARNTERHHSFWQSNSGLRHTKVHFVHGAEPTGSKGTDVPELEAQNVDIDPERIYDLSRVPDDAFAEMISRGEATRKDTREADDTSLITISQGKLEVLAEGIDDRHGTADGQFMVDLMGSRKHHDTGISAPFIRSPSPDSSEEIVVFAGRNRAGNAPSAMNTSVPRLKSKITSRSQTEAGQQLILDLHSRVPVVISDSMTGIEPSENVETQTNLGVLDPAFYQVNEKTSVIAENSSTSILNQSPITARLTKPEEPQRVPCSRKRRQRRNENTTAHDEDAIISDYIANIQENADLTNDFVKGSNNTDGVGRQKSHSSDADESQDVTEGSSPRKQLPNSSNKERDWGPLEVNDFDDLSTSQEVLEVVELILSKRERPGGLQYLIVWEGYSIDDARWIPISLLTTPDILEQIRLFEEDAERIEEYPAGSDDTSEKSVSSEDSDQETDEEEQDGAYEQDLLDRKVARMTDERLARLLAKQAELGINSDDLVIFDDDEDEVEYHEIAARRSPWKSRPRANLYKRPKGAFPSATLLADALDKDGYNGFDVMDHERPSLQKKIKGRRGALPFELSDTELEMAQYSAWDNDRHKKKVKKQEREELRAQGLLGKKNRNKADMKAKYTEGMTMDEVKEEIKGFLISRHESLPLPPMDKKDRKIVHEIANAFKLKSKSIGGGRSRFPVLYKTSRTTNFDEGALGMINSRMTHRRFIPRMDKGYKKGPVASRRSGGGFAGTAVSYRDGEVVGATAPELGMENRGRAMLEKMGWSTGTALGSVNNKGILQPVAHVVKTTKAGLG